MAFSDIPCFAQIDVYSSLQADFTVTCDTCVEHSAELPTAPANVFKLALRGLNTLGEQRELLAGVDLLCSSILLSEVHMQSLERQLSAHPAELEWLRCEK